MDSGDCRKDESIRIEGISQRDVQDILAEQGQALRAEQVIDKPRMKRAHRSYDLAMTGLAEKIKSMVAGENLRRGYAARRMPQCH